MAELLLELQLSGRSTPALSTKILLLNGFLTQVLVDERGEMAQRA